MSAGIVLGDQKSVHTQEGNMSKPVTFLHDRYNSPKNDLKYTGSASFFVYGFPLYVTRITGSKDII